MIAEKKTSDLKCGCGNAVEIQHNQDAGALISCECGMMFFLGTGIDIEELVETDEKINTDLGVTDDMWQAKEKELITKAFRIATRTPEITTLVDALEKIYYDHPGGLHPGHHSYAMENARQILKGK